MGQKIEVTSVVAGDVALFEGDRSITGQDGYGFSSVSESEAIATTAARLAAQLFGNDAKTDYVFVLSNQVTVRRADGWSEESVAETIGIIRDFFVFYEENRGEPPKPSQD